MNRSKELIDRRLRLEEDLLQLEEGMVQHASQLKNDALDMARPGRMFKRFPMQTVAAGVLSGALLAWGISRLFRGSTEANLDSQSPEGAEEKGMDASFSRSAGVPAPGMAAGRAKPDSLRQVMSSELKRAIAQQAALFFTRTMRDALEPRETERQPS